LYVNTSTRLKKSSAAMARHDHRNLGIKPMNLTHIPQVGENNTLQSMDADRGVFVIELIIGLSIRAFEALG
jgi:hypothetical protein